MNKQHKNHINPSGTGNPWREQLLDGLQVSERRIQFGGVNTALLIGGDGPPLVLLHGPGESSFWWIQVIPELIKGHRVIVPDLPGHGASSVTDDLLESDQVLNWLYVIENSGDDPKLEQPEAFLKALYTVLESNGTNRKVGVGDYESHKNR